MSRPRNPFGAQQPGRLPSTMMKVLAAEMCDASRLRRGKQYAKDGSVLDIIVEEGTVTCEVQGSRSVPYIASLEVSRGDGMPLRRDVRARCSCPDDDNWDGHVCKHVVATMFTFADELLIEPALLDVWRGNDVDADRSGADDEDDEAWPADVGSDRAGGARAGSDDDGPDEERPVRRRRHLELVRDGVERSREARERGESTEPDEVFDPIAPHLSVPDGTSLPDVPRLERIEPRPPRRQELADVLRDAVANLRLDWD